MATERDWAAAFCAQAREDLHAAARLGGLEPSGCAILLQMFFEKIAKAALLRSGQAQVADVTRSHAAAKRMVQTLARDRRACQRLGWTPARVGALRELVETIERAQPQLAAGGPNLEYPWESPLGEVQWPAQHHPLVAQFRAKTGSKGQLLFLFAHTLSARFDAVFPELRRETRLAPR